MLTKNELKYYSSLNQKKFRTRENKFIVEGSKIVEEGLLSNFRCEIIIATHEFFEDNQEYMQRLVKKNRLEIIKNPEYRHLTDTVSPQGISAVFNKPQYAEGILDSLNSRFVVCLENISDPGNVGTIIRTCDWFGIKEILFTNNCADIYNPKTLRACMGSVFHLRLFEDITTDRLNAIKKSGYKIICADLNGKNLYDFEPSGKNIIIFSNEASGPSSEISGISDEVITIPKLGKAESLNVAGASAVILARCVF